MAIDPKWWESEEAAFDSGVSQVESEDEVIPAEGMPERVEVIELRQAPAARTMVGFDVEAPDISPTALPFPPNLLPDESIRRLKAGVPHLAEMLVANRLITPEQRELALQEQAQKPAPMGQILVKLGFISESLLVRALSAQMGVSPWFLDKEGPAPEAIALLPGELCEKYELLPVAVKGDVLVIAMRHPMDVEAIDLAHNVSKRRIEVVYANEERLIKGIKAAYGAGRGTAIIDNLVTQAMDEATPRRGARDTNHLTEIETRPVVGMVNTILSDAIRMGASDIHIEPRSDRMDVRYRVDGQMHLVRELPSELIPMLAARIKIMAELDIVENRIPQDGHIKVVLDGREVDLRVSVLPNFHGPRIVLRVLDKTMSLKKLEDLGFTQNNLTLFRSLVEKPYGVFLVTGPTGSGKTTTLYAALAEMNDGTSTILTCEDPVEYDIDGIGQSQVNEKVGLTFAKQLKAILRQDPDTVLVGEIRDAETAETAVRASITGHMVLSTLHCNNAPGAIPRLKDMGVDPFLLSTSLVGVMSQRLARILCPHCRKKQPAGEMLQNLWSIYLGGTPPEYEWLPVGCKECHGTGYKGRRAIHEIMPVTKEVAEVIARHGTTEDLHEAAVPFGYVTLQEAALEVVEAGTTSLAEARRVIFFDDARQPKAASEFRKAS